jgi:hypothetical protein
VSANSYDIVRACGFAVSFGCTERRNPLTRDPECLYCLGRFNRPSGISAADFMKNLGIG